MDPTTKKSLGLEYEQDKNMYLWYKRRYEYIRPLQVPPETKMYLLKRMEEYKEKYQRLGVIISS